MIEPQPLIHLVCGSTGSGKTTYSLALTEQIGGVRFSLDEWMTTLFWMDSPQPLVPAWSLERVDRCLTQIWAIAQPIARRQVPCVLDVGLTTIALRERFTQAAAEAALGVQLHFLDIPAAERWRRVEARDASRGATRQLAFDVTRDMFDFVETLWEPPTPAEMRLCHGIHITG